MDDLFELIDEICNEQEILNASPKQTNDDNNFLSAICDAEVVDQNVTERKISKGKSIELINHSLCDEDLLQSPENVEYLFIGDNDHETLREQCYSQSNSFATILYFCDKCLWHTASKADLKTHCDSCAYMHSCRHYIYDDKPNKTLVLCFDRVNSFITNLYFTSSFFIDTSNFEKPVSEQRIFVLYNNQTLIGFLKVTPGEPESTFIFIFPKLRKSGYASFLLRVCQHFLSSLVGNVELHIPTITDAVVATTIFSSFYKSIIVNLLMFLNNPIKINAELLSHYLGVRVSIIMHELSELDLVSRTFWDEHIEHDFFVVQEDQLLQAYFNMKILSGTKKVVPFCYESFVGFNGSFNKFKYLEHLR